MFIKFFTFLLLLAIVSSMSIHTGYRRSYEPDLSEARKCIPDANYYDGCNWCTCYEGGFIGCTRKGCQTYNAETGRFETPKELPPPDNFWEKNESN
ncbi:uncharacterized protein LOC114878783 [Osmia bicornis bicornis]|uniref:uncharacterized protein LOC114878783 n=1 Tax=Osmia bicornis bicornis TaxID=1437191 RepID=UPI0010F6ADE6|nr:uncharacterized protein LOC114878783 [Osmia bicornis bicornis]